MLTYIIAALCAMQMFSAFFMQEYDMGFMALVALTGWITVIGHERASKNERQDLLD